MSLVEVRHLWITYGRLHAVKGISFEIPRGEIFGFIGPNGAGKTSTIKAMATLLKPSRGKVLVDGLDVVAKPHKVRERIGYVPDSFGVYEDLTAEEYLQFFAAAYRLPISQRSRTVKDVLALTDLTGKRFDQVESLSRGMKQRLSLARVLLHNPSLLLLDEPASGLDPRARIEIRELLKELQGMGKTIFISSHILHELSQMCTRIAILEAGKLIVEGSLEDIYRKIDLQRTVHVQLANPSEELVTKISRLSGVVRVERDVDRLSLRVHEDGTQLEDLLEGIQSCGGRVRMFQPEVMDMETAFMKLTEGRTA